MKARALAFLACHTTFSNVINDVVVPSFNIHTKHNAVPSVNSKIASVTDDPDALFRADAAHACIYLYGLWWSSSVAGMGRIYKNIVRLICEILPCVFVLLFVNLLTAMCNVNGIVGWEFAQVRAFVTTFGVLWLYHHRVNVFGVFWVVRWHALCIKSEIKSFLVLQPNQWTSLVR